MQLNRRRTSINKGKFKEILFTFFENPIESTIQKWPPIKTCFGSKKLIDAAEEQTKKEILKFEGNQRLSSKTRSQLTQ